MHKFGFETAEPEIYNGPIYQYTSTSGRVYNFQWTAERRSHVVWAKDFKDFNEMGVDLAKSARWNLYVITPFIESIVTLPTVNVSVSVGSPLDMPKSEAKQETVAEVKPVEKIKKRPARRRPGFPANIIDRK